MSIPVPITENDFNKLDRQLAKKQEIACLDKATHIRTLLVAQNRLMMGKLVNAKIVKGYE